MAESDDQNPYRSPNSSRDSADTPELPRTYMPGELFVVSSFKDSVEAHLFKNELENNGIKATIDSETMTALFSGPSSIFWTEVLVMGSDSERALEIKKKWNANAENRQTVEIPEWICKCGKTVDQGFAVCWNCGAEHEENST